MAVTPAVPLLKSQPDMSKLNAFAGYMVSVTKHLGPKGTPGTAVVPTQKMDKDKLLALQVHLPLQYGAGYYQFTVTDEGGTGADEWMVKLGTEVAPTQEGLPMGQPPYMQQPPMPGTPLDPGVTQIMPGWFYNEAANLLMAPWKKTYSWKMGDPMPDPPPTGSHLSLVPQNATPWTWPGQQQPWASGWGTYPATETKSPELDVIKQQLAEEREARKDAERRESERQREERIREEMRRDREAAEARFEKLLATITAANAKPAGPTEAEQRLLREAEENRRRLEETERRAEADRKEAQRREEMRIADERHREEMRLMREEIKAATANKTDPMMTLFGTILQTQSANATETARMIRETSQAAQAASERSTTQVLELARSQRESASESSKTVLEGMKGLMEMQTGVYNQLLDVAGQGSQPWYAGVLQEGVGKIGLIGQALMDRNQAAAQQPQYAAPQRVVQGRPIPQPARQAYPQVAPVPAAPAAATVVGTGTRPPDAEYDPATEEFVFPDGWRVKQAVVQQTGWVAVMKRRPQPQAAAPVAAPAVPANGVNGAAAPVAAAPPPTVVTPDTIIPPPAAAAPKPVKNGKKKRNAAAPPPPAPAPAEGLPPPANGQGYSLEELREFDTDQVLELIRPLDDTALFGAMLPYVNDLRTRAANGLPVQKAADFILGTRQYIHSFGASPPPAFDLLASEHLEALTERLLPDAPEEYQDAVIDLMEKKLVEENPQRAEMTEQ